jgi:hypothetical protein
MCSGEKQSARLSLTSIDTSGDVAYTFGLPVETASFQKIRITWNLLSTTGKMNVQPVLIYFQDGLTFAGMSTVGSADDAVGLHVEDLAVPTSSYRYVVPAFSVSKQVGALTVESGAIWATAEYL